MQVTEPILLLNGVGYTAFDILQNKMLTSLLISFLPQRLEEAIVIKSEEITNEVVAKFNKRNIMVVGASIADMGSIAMRDLSQHLGDTHIVVVEDHELKTQRIFERFPDPIPITLREPQPLIGFDQQKQSKADKEQNKYRSKHFRK